MTPRFFVNTLLTVLLVLPLVAGGVWWWSIQPGLLPLTEQKQQTLTLPQGLRVTLFSDPEMAHTDLTWQWSVGTAADTAPWLGRHQLFLQALVSGQMTDTLPSLAVQMARDPLGHAELHIDRRHTALQVQSSVGATQSTLTYFAQLLNQTDWAPPMWQIHRQALTDVDPVYAFLTQRERQHIDRVRPMARPTLQSPKLWLDAELEELSRMMARYRDDYFLPNAMSLSIRSPLSMPELEAQFQSSFAEVLHRASERSSASEQGAHDWTIRGAMSYGLATEGDQAITLRLMFPWSLPAELRSEVANAVAWFNSPLAQAPRQQLQAAGLVQDVHAHATDELLLIALELAASDEASDAVILATVQNFIEQLFTSEQRRRLRLDTSQFWQHDFRPSAAGQVQELPMPDQSRAIRLPPPPRTLPIAQVSQPRESQYDLMGRQPSLVRSDQHWRAWYLPDQHFGTRLTHLSVLWPHPMGSDPLVHAQWQQWFERYGPGLAEAVWQAEQHVLTPAQGFHVEVDDAGIHWHLTHDWPTIERWLPQWLAHMQQLDAGVLGQPEPRLRIQQLLRDRAQLETPSAFTSQPNGPIQLLVSGRVEANQLTRLLSQLQPTAVSAQVEPRSEWRLAEGHQLAELTAPNGVSRVSTWVELPHSDHRHRTLAEASLPWLRATLEQQLLARDIAAQLTVNLSAPAGRLGLEVVLESQSLDPARLNLQLTALWRDLNAASQNRSSETLQEELQWRADRYRETPSSLVAASQFYWSDIVAQRLHFNGRMRSARTLESTNLDGWTFFMQQWLFANTARRLTVNEVGANWADIYQELRRPPPDARPW